MSTTSGAPFHYQIDEARDENDFKFTVIKCRGRLIGKNTSVIREVVQPHIVRGARIVLDFAELEYLDSSGLGAIVGLKVSAMNRGRCVLELKNLTPRVKELLTITNLLQLFSAISKCRICGQTLNVSSKPETLDCGGDCLKCMADSGDAECVEMLRQTLVHRRSTPGKAIEHRIP
jgi:anti-anti-sigma factor